MRFVTYRVFLSILALDFVCRDSQIYCFLHLQKIQDNNEMLSYWLSNASTLLLLLQRTLKASGAAGMAPLRRRSSSATLFGRMSMSHVKDSFLFLFSIDRGNNLLSEFFSFPYVSSLTALFLRASEERHKE